MMTDSLSEILKPLVSGIVGALVTAVVLYLRSRRGNRVVIYRVSETPQVRISESVRQNLSIRYKEQAVDNLVLNTLRIANGGAAVVEPLAIRFSILPSYGEIDFLELEHVDPLSKTRLQRDGNTFTLTRDFLNPQRAYKEEKVELNIFSNTKLNFSVVGGGKAWYARFEDRALISERLPRIVKPMFIAFLLSALLQFVPGIWTFIAEPKPGFAYWYLTVGSGAFVVTACIVFLYLIKMKDSQP